MFNTMTLTKAAGAFIGALLFLMLANWAATAIFHVGPAGHAGGDEEHGEGEITQAYSIPVPESAEGGADAEEEIDFAALMESADAARGEREWAKCRACHALDGTDGVGPHLNGVVGREVASVDGFGYSGAMQDHAAEVSTWDPEPLQVFLTNPRNAVPGTAMSFAGLKDAQARANLIAFLEQNS
ncbi:cytochrome c family protein [Paracoccus sp. 1_MG-2023]|uniref:c-type cytochrome n=1 Tax=unclassified Paracoccus (in: a-proteobacteria) TaxID=2688777 RepID=UPI001C095923|nr:MULTISPECIES: cytochrome c family protein [unclassified Paracoccus (in: a-proteobacteria)]MBU2958414.1 cytochrome c family protein [Paracoccus sp. C2R09]MDO6668601.1 cytochrome c family protein [Paracoccus sp. 1_MG-2023]